MSKYSFKKVTSPAGAAPATPAEQKPIDVGTTPVTTPPPVAPAPAVASSVPAVASSVPAVVAPATGAVTEYRQPASYGDDSESVGVGDIILPRINIVQKVGDLSNIFVEGDIVFGKETVLYKSPKTDKATKPLRVIVAGLRSDRYAEKTIGGARGSIVETPEEVVEKGGTTDYNIAEAAKKAGRPVPFYQPLAEALILIEKPEGIEDPAFSYVADGKSYAIALWAMKGVGYTNGAKVLRTARKAGWLKDDFDPITGQIKLKRGYGFGVWELGTELAQYGSNFAWKPVLRRVEYSTPEVQALAAQLTS